MSFVLSLIRFGDWLAAPSRKPDETGSATVPIAPAGVPPTGLGETTAHQVARPVGRGYFRRDAENSGRDATRSPFNCIVPVKSLLSLSSVSFGTSPAEPW